MKKLLTSLAVLAVAFVSIFQATSAVFEESVKVAGTSFTVGTTAGGGDTGNTALKMLLDVSGSNESTNLTDTTAGPSFDNIDAEWVDTILVKLYNQGAETLDVVSNVEYINDPDTLRDDIFVEILSWDDVNNNGLLDAGEEGVSYGYDTILRLKNDIFLLGMIEPGEVKGLALKFDGTGVTDYNFGQSAVYDFEFVGMGQL